MRTLCAYIERNVTAEGQRTEANMVAYRHDEYGTGTSRSRRFYAVLAAASALVGSGLAILTFS